MGAIVDSVELDAGQQAAFDYIVDPAHFTEWQDAVVRAELEGGGPIGSGSRVAMVRRMGKREQQLTTEFTEFERPLSYAFRGIDGPIRAVGRGIVEPLGEDRSKFTFSLDFEGKGFGKLLVPMVRKQARREVAETHAKLRERFSRPG